LPPSFMEGMPCSRHQSSRHHSSSSRAATISYSGGQEWAANRSMQLSQHEW
jgi:hypothetical protein